MSREIVTTDEYKASSSSEIIVTLAKHALDNLKWNRRHNLGPTNFREEFGTVKIALPRQSGHSTAALQLMYEYPDSLLFVPNHPARDYSRQLLGQYTDDHEVHERICKNIIVPQHASVIQLPVRLNRPFIIFDEAAAMQPEMIHRVLNSLNASIILELQ